MPSVHPVPLRLIIHIMSFRALPQNSQIDIGFEANEVFAPKVIAAASDGLCPAHGSHSGSSRPVRMLLRED